MITVEKLEKGTYFDDAFKISFRYDPTTVAKVKELAERRYLPEDRAWEIPAHELPALIEKVGLSNIKSEEAVVQALNTKEIEDKREATQERLKGIKPVRDFDFKTAPLPHQIEAFNYGMEKNSLLIGDEQGLGKTKESIDICVARKKELIKTLIVCGVNSVKYNWEKEIQIHSNEGCVMVDGKTMDVRVQQLNDWYRGSSYFGIINIESLRNEKIQDALYLGIKDGYIGAIIVDEIHKAKNGGSQQGKALRFLKAPVKIGLSGTPMNKAEDLWNILTWLGVERRSFYSFRNAYCTIYNSPYEATLILRDSLAKGDKIDIMDFPMPQCLLKDGYYTGQIIATLVYDPVLDPSQGIEYCQSNIDVKFGSYDTKEERDTSKRHILNPVGRKGSQNLLLGTVYSKNKMKEKSSEFALKERLLIQYADKYYPVKKYAVDLSELTEKKKIEYLSPDKKWFLFLQGVYRDHIERMAQIESFALTQEFCLILTIRDPNQKEHVYDEVTQKLDEYNFWHSNIRVATDVNIPL